MSFALALTASLNAQERLTSATLNAWQATGASPMAEPNTGAITVPVGGQLVRAYQGSKVTVRLVSRPYFRAKPADWPTLEVGPAALSFVQDGAGGGLVMLGDQPLAIPQSIALGADGRSVRELDLSLTYDGDRREATLVLEAASYKVSATAATPEVIVAVSAGGETAWPLGILEVSASSVTGEPDATAADAGSDGDNPKTAVGPGLNPAVPAAERKQAFEEALALCKSQDYATAEKKLLASNRHKHGTLGWHLESAGKLTQMALVLRQQYDLKGALVVAQRAQVLLTEGEQAAAPTDGPRQRAAVHEMKGYLNDELLRDPTAARADYERAGKIDVGSVRAKRALDRLDEEKAKSARVGAKN